MENAARAQILASQTRPFFRPLALHLGGILGVLILGLIFQGLLRARRGLGLAADCLRPQPGHPQPLIPLTPYKRFAFPVKIAVEGPMRDGERDPLAGAADLLIIRQNWGQRHGGLLLLIAALAAGMAWMQEAQQAAM